jgi:RNA polymerase sigma-70 factor (ECF subfamily)
MDGEFSNLSDRDLVANLGWVQRLAVSLARNGDADDLAQDVARVWLEKRPALVHSPREWLASVARKLALDRARSEDSRAARERSVARTEAQSFEVVERGARQRRVVDAVLQLDEPYRSTILYRYLDDLSTREVALRMGVLEPTVRKRVERALALLRERFEREHGARADAWFLALLEPGLRNAAFKGVGLMSMKWIAAASLLVLLAGSTWYARSHSGPVFGEAVGGAGMVVPSEITAAREQPLSEASSLEEMEAPRAAVENAPMPTAPGLRGLVFVDDQRLAPSDLEITWKDSGPQSAVEAHVDAAAASWSLDTLGGEPGRLWITSSSTVPAMIPVPAELWEHGGTFDLKLTKQPLPRLAFQVDRRIELERSLEHVRYDGNQSTHVTDERGQALVTGLPRAGSVSVTVDCSQRDRDVVLGDGSTTSMRYQRQPDWHTRLADDESGDLEQTLLVRPPLGEACANGEVPAWAIALAGGAELVRVVARDTTHETPQGRSQRFALEQDEQGRFQLCASSPGTAAVWLERKADGQRLSAETALSFAEPGAQSPITFRELGGRQLELTFLQVPERGNLQVRLVGKGSTAPPLTLTCEGATLSQELTVTEDQNLMLSLRVGANVHDKSCWSRLVKVEGRREITVDLSGGERNVRFECPEIGELANESTIGFMHCDHGQVDLEQGVTVLCTSGRASTAVHIPNGRWLWRYDDRKQPAIWGTVDVVAAKAGEELLLQPKVRLVPAEELGAGVRFDEIGGQSLADLPVSFRSLSTKSPGERIVVPVDAKYVLLEPKK